MNIIEFNGYKCIEHPLNEWQHWVCKHLRSYVSKPGDNSQSSLVRILQDGSKSSEIFLFIQGPLQQIIEQDSSPVKGNNEVIACDSCWTNVYDAKKL